MAVKPISPQDVPQEKLKTLPDEVIQTWNTMIAEKMTGNGYCTILQRDIADRIASVMGVSRQEVFDNQWLDIEDIYREAGWKVSYDKPAYNETYAAYFTFSRR
jgi:hypothetical protein